MNKHDRAELVRAMDKLARAINDEDIFEYWLIDGVADGDIDGTETDLELEYYTENKTFSELMNLFLSVMTRAKKSGGLYFDGIISEI